MAVIRELASGAYGIPVLGADDLDDCAGLIDRYQDQDIGITDASLVVLAARYDTNTILTLDHRHFDVLRPRHGGGFRIVPS